MRHMILFILFFCKKFRNVDATTFARDFGRTASLRRVVARSQSRPLARCTDRTGHFWNIRSRVSLSLSTAKAHLHIWRRCRSFDGTHPGLPRDHFTKSESKCTCTIVKWVRGFPDQRTQFNFAFYYWNFFSCHASEEAFDFHGLKGLDNQAWNSNTYWYYCTTVKHGYPK